MPPLRSLDLVVHGTRAGDTQLRAAVGQLRAAGHRVRVHVTWESGDARRLARLAAAREPDVVVAVGGDGTLNEVLNGVLRAAPPGGGRPVPVGIVPLGTANDFARQAAVPTDPGDALALCAYAPFLRLDVAFANGRAFLNVSSIGSPAEVTTETSTAAKHSLGVFAYALTGLRRFASDGLHTVARVTAPEFVHEGEYLLIAVGNARTTGGGTAVTPLAEPDDGLLDVCLVEPVAAHGIAKLLLELRRGDHLDRDGVHYFQVPWLRVESERSFAVNVDGEPARSRTLAYSVRPGLLDMPLGRLPGRDALTDDSASVT